jgi:hypothetical protein
MVFWVGGLFRRGAVLGLGLGWSGVGVGVEFGGEGLRCADDRIIMTAVIIGFEGMWLPCVLMS